jgi:tRNA pseudouridine38-40 synthase
MQILLTLSYDGTNYFGWQKQKTFVSVQEVLETALKKVYTYDVSTVSCSRTDSGVHALNQKVMYSLEVYQIPIPKLPRVINYHLPNDIVVTNAKYVDDLFHPRYLAKIKIYQYKVYNSIFLNPIFRLYCYHYPSELDLSTMRQCMYHFIGTHDFKAFCATNTSTKTTVRTIYSFEVEYNNIDNIFTFTISGSGFLYNMVRIIIGTVLEFGTKKIDPSIMGQIILSKDRRCAGRTSPSHGLTLLDILY